MKSYKEFIKESKSNIDNICIEYGIENYIKFINEYDVIQDNKVILDRLEEVYHELDMKIPDNIEFDHYEII